MENDFISNTITNNNTEKIIKKLYIFAIAVLILYITYAIFELMNWYLFFGKTYKIKQGFVFFYYYRVVPITSIFLLALQLLNASLVYKFYDYILQSIKNNDPSLFNKGFKLGYKAFYIVIGSSVIAIAGSVCRFFLSLNL